MDLRYAVRMLVKRPGFAAVAVITLALGVGANTAIFSVVNAVLLRSLPYSEPDRLVMIYENPGGNPRNHVNPRNYADWRDNNQVFERVAAWSTQSLNLTGAAEPERVIAAAVGADFFSVLGVNAALGRTFLSGEDAPASPRTAVISHGLWQRRFGSDASVLGQTLSLNGESTTVVGIMPADFRFPTQVELWIPLAFTPQQMADNNRGSHFLRVVGRLGPAVSVTQAQGEMNSFYDRLREQYPQQLTNWTPNVVLLHEDQVGGIRSSLLILLGAVCFVLLIACANVANLLLARSLARQREIAIRAALGATRLRLVGHLLTESLLLAIAGGVVGVLLALWGIDLLVYLKPEDIPRLEQVSIDGRVLAFTIEGEPPPPPGQRHFAYLRWISPDYFQTLGIPLLRGRLFTDSDAESRPWVTVIDEAMERQFFAGQDPLGKRIRIYAGERNPREIIGVVGNVKQTGLDQQAGPHTYVPYYQTPLGYATLIVKTKGEATEVAAAMKKEVLAVDNDQPVYSVMTMEQIISSSVAQRRFNTLLLLLFACIALLLAAVGIYGVMSQAVSHRTQEIGIRMALGAQTRDVLRLVVGQAMKLAITGVAIGLIAAFALTRVLESLLYGVSATDAATFLVVASLLTGVALAASFIPARRATRVDPMIALRYE
jgi:ABC-type antimicrobial peptide transport system permease subunit